MADQEALEQQKKQCIFCRIAAKEMEAHICYEDEAFLGILDINPARKGHVLFFPREHYPIIAMVPPPVFSAMTVALKKLCNSMEKALGASNVDLMIASGGAAGQRLPHLAVHMIPREEKDGFTSLFVSDAGVNQSQKEEAVNKLKDQFTALFGKAFQNEKPLSKEQVIELIKQNQQLKQIILHNPEEFKKLATQHPQLKVMFSKVPVDEVIAAVTAESKSEKSENKKEKDQPPKGEQKSLDEISDFLKDL